MDRRKKILLLGSEIKISPIIPKVYEVTEDSKILVTENDKIIIKE